MELSPCEYDYHHLEYGCDQDRHNHDHEVLIVKFKRSDVLNVLPEGNHVKAEVTGSVNDTQFDEVDIIRVIK